MALADAFLRLGAALAGDGIPLHFGDQAAEYHAALHDAVVMDRSHEGRLSLRGPDALALVQRMSTNDVAGLAPTEAAPTIFTSPIGRILDRVTLVRRADDVLALTEPGRGPAVLHYLQRNIFFTDQVQAVDLASETSQFVLMGPAAGAALASISPALGHLSVLRSAEAEISGVLVSAVRTKPLAGEELHLLVPQTGAEMVWDILLQAGASAGLRPAGSLTYHVLRVRAGRPGVGRELSPEYIPLEVGLWDEVSFTKGCYTGQEIIARMESRGRLAKTLVRLSLDRPIDTPATLLLDGKTAGTLTSAAQAPDGVLHALGVVKLAAAVPGTVLRVEHEGATAQATITALAGTQPPGLAQEEGL